jgi:hypothetical protein
LLGCRTRELQQTRRSLTRLKCRVEHTVEPQPIGSEHNFVFRPVRPATTPALLVLLDLLRVRCACVSTLLQLLRPITSVASSTATAII